MKIYSIQIKTHTIQMNKIKFCNIAERANAKNPVIKKSHISIGEGVQNIIATKH